MSIKKLLVLPLCLGILATTPLTAAASTNQAATSASTASITTNRSKIKFSEFLNTGYLWVDMKLNGAKFTSNDPNEIRDAISTNYDIDLTLALKNNANIELGHYDRSPQLRYNGPWKITIDKSVLSVPYDLTTTLQVENDSNATAATVSTVKTLTAKELADGVVIRLDIRNGNFNIQERGELIARSIRNSTNLMLQQVGTSCYCQSPKSVYVKLKSYEPTDERTFSFVLDETTTNTGEPIRVSIGIVQ